MIFYSLSLLYFVNSFGKQYMLLSHSYPLYRKL